MKKKILVLALSAVFIGVAAWLGGFVVTPRLAEWRRLSERLSMLGGALAERQELLTRAERLGERLSQSTREQEGLKLFLPEQKEPASLIAVIAGLAGGRGVILESIGFPGEAESGSVSFAGRDTTGPARPVPVRLKATASYQGLKSFLGALSTSARLIDVERLNVASAQDSDVLSLEATLTSYYRGE